METSDNFLPSDKAADYLGISLKTLYRRIEEGTIPYNRVARLYLFDRNQLAQLEKGPRRPGRKPQQASE